MLTICISIQPRPSFLGNICYSSESKQRISRSTMKTGKRGRPPKQLPTPNYPEMTDKEYAQISAGIERLEGREIMAMFNNQKDFLELCHRGQRFPTIFDRFCWRLQYILGEIFLFIQNTLHQLKYLENAYMLKLDDIRELACCLIEKAKQPSRDKEFAGLRNHFEKIFNKNQKDQIGEYLIVRLYGICLRIWKRPLDIDVSITEQKWESAEPLIPKHIEAPLKVQELSFQARIRRQAIEMMADSPTKLPSPTQAIAQDDIIHLDKPSAPNNRQPGKCYNRNWSLQVQASFCKLYAKLSTSQQIKDELQKIHGKDVRWASAYQIDSKMHGIAAKVFKKLTNLETSNPNIIKFRTLRSFILSSDQITPEQRRALFKIVAIIYQAMMDVKDPAKKQTISEKILQVLQLCKHFEVPLK